MSKIISIYNLSLRDCFTLSLAPVNTKNDNSIVIYEKVINHIIIVVVVVVIIVVVIVVVVVVIVM